VALRGKFTGVAIFIAIALFTVRDRILGFLAFGGGDRTSHNLWWKAARVCYVRYCFFAFEGVRRRLI